MKIDPHEELARTTRRIAGLTVEVVRSRGGAYCGWSRDVERVVVGIAHPDHFKADDTRPTYSMMHGAGPTRREALASAAASCRTAWLSGSSLWT